MALTGVFLGVVSDLTRTAQGYVTLRIKPERADKLVTLMRSILKAGRLTSGAASTIRGKLQFAISTAWGKLGRAGLQPFMTRQYHEGTRSRLTTALLMALTFFVTLLPIMPARELKLFDDGLPTVCIFSDAAWEKKGTLGWIIYIPDPTGGDDDRGYYSYYVVPAWLMNLFVKKKTYIGQLEILAAMAPYLSMPSLLMNRDVYHWIDNTSAISCLLHGYSGKPDSAMLVNVFHMFNAALRCNIFWDFVKSADNISDLPSRGNFKLMIDMGMTWVETDIPALEHWTGPLLDWYYMVRPTPRHKSRSKLSSGAKKARRRAARM